MDNELDKYVSGFRKALKGIDSLLHALNLSFLCLGTLGVILIVESKRLGPHYIIGMMIPIALLFAVNHIARVLAFGTAWTLLCINDSNRILAKVVLSEVDEEQLNKLTQQEPEEDFSRDEKGNYIQPKNRAKYRQKKEAEQKQNEEIRKKIKEEILEEQSLNDKKD